MRVTGMLHESGIPKAAVKNMVPVTYQSPASYALSHMLFLVYHPPCPYLSPQWEFNLNGVRFSYWYVPPTQTCLLITSCMLRSTLAQQNPRFSTFNHTLPSQPTPRRTVIFVYSLRSLAAIDSKTPSKPYKHLLEQLTKRFWSSVCDYVRTMVRARSTTFHPFRANKIKRIRRFFDVCERIYMNDRLDKRATHIIREDNFWRAGCKIVQEIWTFFVFLGEALFLGITLLH